MAVLLSALALALGAVGAPPMELRTIEVRDTEAALGTVRRKYAIAVPSSAAASSSGSLLPLLLYFHGPPGEGLGVGWSACD